MERSNYNRSSNGGTYNSGGRSNGGRGSWVAQGVGRGDGGRGRGDGGRGRSGGDYPRGGRNGNYRPQYSNQQPEQYGGGRGRGYGGHVNNHRQEVPPPDRGTLATDSVKLLVNHFPVKFDPSKSIFHYDFDVKQEMESKQDGASSSRPVKRTISKSDLRSIQEKLCSEYPDQFPLLQTAYDGIKNIYSAVLLPAGTYNVQLYGRYYTCTIKDVKELKLSKLQDFLDGKEKQVPRDVLQALDVVMKANLVREKVCVGGSMYAREYRREDDLGCGVAAFRGSQQSLKVTSNGLVLCLDYSVIPFRKSMPVLDFLKECIWGFDINHIWRFKDEVLSALYGVRVSVTHRCTNQKYTVSGLSEKPTRDISFELVDFEGNQEAKLIELIDYFKEKWGKEIMFKGIPCLMLGNGKQPNYVPMEFCFLADDRRFPQEQLSKEVDRKLKELSLLVPDERRSEICRMVSEEYATGRKGAEIVKNFGIEVGMEMTEVDGRVMSPPKLKLGSASGKTNVVTVDKVKCSYNLLHGRTLVAGKAVERWALIDFSCADRRNRLLVEPFIEKLVDRCKNTGVFMEEPILVHPANMRTFSDVNKLQRLITSVVEDCSKRVEGRLQLIVCVMSETHDGHKDLKWVCETKIGVITQCCLSQNANKGNDQTLANIAMKINAKLGGSNVELVERFPHFSENDRFMFIGADVNHPAASNNSSPSIAAVVGSVNWPFATRYAAHMSPQTNRQEEIVDFGKWCLKLVNSHEKENGVKPNKIVVFRDGVSDGQFDMVLNKEMADMKAAIYSQDYHPFITYVVAQKRHTTRLFLKNRKDLGNVPPGTVVDTAIVHPDTSNFYLCSHFGVIGTSKPTHYSMIWDENKFSSYEMQKLVNHLCYIFARCTKPVSLVPPVYYADLVAYRGRMYQEVVNGTQPSGSQGSQSASFDQYMYNCEEHLEDSMFFI